MTPFDTAVLSSPGGRPANEDFAAFDFADHTGCWILADGLGGHVGGATASGLATGAALESFRADPQISPDAIAMHIARANQAVRDGQQAQPDRSTMRTTIVVLAASPEYAIWGHVGDTRLYLFRGGKVAGQTCDHSVPQRLADAGEIQYSQIRFHEDRNRLLRSLGSKPEPGAAILGEPLPLEPGDTFLLATDGLWERIVEPEMEELLATSANMAAWLTALEQLLRTRATPGFDNFSGIAVRRG